MGSFSLSQADIMRLLLTVFFVFVRLACVRSEEHEEQQCVSPDQTRAAQDELQKCRDNLLQVEERLALQTGETTKAQQRAQDVDQRIVQCEKSKQQIAVEIQAASAERQADHQKLQVESEKAHSCEAEKQKLQTDMRQSLGKERSFEKSLDECKKRTSDFQSKADDCHKKVSSCLRDLSGSETSSKSKDTALSACKEESSQLKNKRSELEAKLNEKHKLSFFASAEQLESLAKNYKIISRNLASSIYNSIFTPWMQDSVEFSVSKTRSLAGTYANYATTWYDGVVNGENYKEFLTSFNQHRTNVKSNQYTQVFLQYADMGVQQANILKDFALDHYVATKPRVIAAAHDFNRSLNQKLQQYPELRPLVPPGLFDKAVFAGLFLFGWYVVLMVPLCILRCVGRLLGCCCCKKKGQEQRNCCVLAPLRFCCCLFNFLTCGLCRRRKCGAPKTPSTSDAPKSKSLKPSSGVSSSDLSVSPPEETAEPPKRRNQRKNK